VQDQSLLPGVGNVIKIEGLFDAGMHPHCVTSDIDDVWLNCLIRKLRDYARYWYDCCKGPGSSKPNRKNVYGRSNCGVCDSVISLVRDGVLKRITYLCSKCQLMPAQHRLFEIRKQEQRGIPSMNSFVPGKSKICLQAVNTSAVNQQPLQQNAVPKPRWLCLFCTLDNKFDLSVCEICDTPRPKENIPHVEEEAVQTALSSSCFNSESNGLDGNKPVVSLVGSEKISSKSFDVNKFGPSDAVKNFVYLNEEMNASNSSNNSSSNHNSRSRSGHNEITAFPPQPSDTLSSKNDTSGITFMTPQFCKCNVQGTLHRVRKTGLTNSRLFWSCSIRKCDFFSWADGTFPKCQHGAPSTVRRVLKPGPTNGQYFFSCSQTSKCDFFLWSSKHKPPVVPVANAQAVTLKRANPESLTGNPLKKMKPIVIPL
jgi:GRF zinc finger